MSLFISCIKALNLSRRASRAPLKRGRWQTRTLTRATAGTRPSTSATTWRGSSVRSSSPCLSPFSSSSPPPSGDYGQELEKRKFNDKDETDFYSSLEYCAEIVWRGEFTVLDIVRIFTFTLSPEYRLKQQEGDPAMWMTRSVVLPLLKRLTLTPGNTLGQCSTFFIN